MTTDYTPPMLPPISDDQKQQIAKVLNSVMEALKPRHKPIIKSLQDINIKPQLRMVELADGQESVECLVIPIDELMRKEYLHMAGLDGGELGR